MDPKREKRNVDHPDPWRLWSLRSRRILEKQMKLCPRLLQASAPIPSLPRLQAWQPWSHGRLGKQGYG